MTETSLRQDLVTIGVTPEMTLLVHSSLSSIGWVVGGPPTVVRALLNVLGERGTLVMPAATPHCTDPATWASPCESARIEPAFGHECRPSADEQSGSYKHGT